MLRPDVSQPALAETMGIDYCLLNRDDMINRDYRKEIDVAASEKIVPWPYALLIFTLLTVGVVWFAVDELKAYRQRHLPADQGAPIAPDAVPSTPAAAQAITHSSETNQHTAG